MYVSHAPLTILLPPTVLPYLQLNASVVPSTIKIYMHIKKGIKLSLTSFDFVQYFLVSTLNKYVITGQPI